MTQDGSREDLVFETKYKAKEFLREATKFEKEEKKFRLQALQQLKFNDEDSAKLYAEESCGFKSKAMEFRKLAAEMDTAANSLKKADMMKSFDSDMADIVQGMKSLNLNPQSVRYELEQFNKITGDINVEMDAMNIEEDIVVGDQANDLLDELKAEIVAEAECITQPEIINGPADCMDSLLKRVNAI